MANCKFGHFSLVSKISQVLLELEPHNLINSRASLKRTYAVFMPPDGQIERQRRTTDFWNFFCSAKIDTRDVQNGQKACPLLTSCMMFAPPTYR